MVGIWLIVMLVVFVIEPLFHERFDKMARSDPGIALRRIWRLHAMLFAVAALTVLGAVAGAQGFVF